MPVRYIRCHCGVTHMFEIEMLEPDGSTSSFEVHCPECERTFGREEWEIWKAVLDIEHEQRV